MGGLLVPLYDESKQVKFLANSQLSPKLAFVLTVGADAASDEFAVQRTILFGDSAPAFDATPSIEKVDSTTRFFLKIPDNTEYVSVQLPEATGTDCLFTLGSRSYLIHFPKDHDSTKPYPLGLAFHGWGETPSSMELDSGLSEKAGSSAFLVVYPAGLGNKPAWNAGSCCNSANDLDFIRDLLSELPRVANLDQKRIYAVGMSNGAMMPYRCPGQTWMRRDAS